MKERGASPNCSGGSLLSLETWFSLSSPRHLKLRSKFRSTSTAKPSSGAARNAVATDRVALVASRPDPSLPTTSENAACAPWSVLRCACTPSSSPAGDAESAATCLPIIPIFVLPHKRFATPCLLQLARDYLEHDRQTYRQTTRSASGLPVWYESSNQAASAPHVATTANVALRALHLATVWQLLTWLGSQTSALQAALALLSQHDPSDDSHRFAGAVDPHKYRSPERQQILTTARRLLHLSDRWNKTFPERFFPRFATRGGVP